MIKVTTRSWKHILHHHVDTQFTRNENKSKFFVKEDLRELINTAWQHPATRQKNGNPERVFDAGHLVGIDRRLGKPTSIVTVVTLANGDLVTMFPGRR